jgi:hypothetical protein
MSARARGYGLEVTMFEKLSKCFPGEVLDEDELGRRHGKCWSEGGNRIGVDIACTDGISVFAIQCKQRKTAVPTAEVRIFIDYCRHLEKQIGHKIVPILASSIDPTGPGIRLCDEAGVTMIIFPETDSLVANVVSWVTRGKFAVDYCGDCIME